MRRYRAWYRHSTLGMLAHAFAVTARASQPAPAAPGTRRQRRPERAGHRCQKDIPGVKARRRRSSIAWQKWLQIIGPVSSPLARYRAALESTRRLFLGAHENDVAAAAVVGTAKARSSGGDGSPQQQHGSRPVRGVPRRCTVSDLMAPDQFSLFWSVIRNYTTNADFCEWS